MLVPAALEPGSVAQWLTVILAGVVAYALYRGGGGTALSTLQEANRILEKRVHELEAQGKTDAALIAELKGRTDVGLAIKPMSEAMTLHEVRAAQRHEATVNVLGLIPDKLGQENGQAA